MSMVTVRQYINPSEAELDKTLLEEAGIPVFLADANSLSLGYGGVLGGVRLQVEDADLDRARHVLDEREGVTPLPDDFIPPEEPPPIEPPAAPAPAPETKEEWIDTFFWGGVVLLAAFGIIVLVILLVGGFVFATLGGLAILFLVGGLVALVLRSTSPKNGNDEGKNPKE
jgi:Putative prokaryotic signal transducing protein